MVTIEARFDFAENGLFGDIHDAIEQAIEVFNGLGEARVKAWSLMPKSTTTTERK